MTFIVWKTFWVSYEISLILPIDTMDGKFLTTDSFSKRKYRYLIDSFTELSIIHIKFLISDHTRSTMNNVKLSIELNNR